MARFLETLHHDLLYAMRTIRKNPANPVTAGDNILIRAPDWGAVNPPVDAGPVTPDSPPSVTVNAVKVSIGGVDAPVTFARLDPGSTGVYQVRATVPSG